MLEGGTEENEQKDIEEKKADVGNSHVPAGNGRVNETDTGCRKADDQRGNQRSSVIAYRENCCADRRYTQISDCTVSFVFHHEKVRAKCNGDA